jgi:hypothetical protein
MKLIVFSSTGWFFKPENGTSFLEIQEMLPQQFSWTMTFRDLNLRVVQVSLPNCDAQLAREQAELPGVR